MKKVSKKPNTIPGKAGKAKPVNSKFDLQEAARSLDSVVSQQTLDWVEHCVDPKSHPPAPRPMGASLYNGHVEMLDMKAVTTLVIGSNGVGFATVDPSSCAGCTDRVLALATNATATSTLGSTLSVVSGSSVTTVYPSRTGYTGAALGAGNTGQEFTSATNACGVYLKPKGSATSQDGMIYILELPGHPSMLVSGSLTLQQIVDHERTRSIPGNQVGTPGFENVLNWHPQVNSTNPASSESEYLAPNGATSSQIWAPLVIVVTGTAGATYSLEVYGSWLCRGRLAHAVTPNYADVLGMQAFFNTVLLKRISGWMGKPSDAVAAYRIALGQGLSRSLPKERRKKDKEKAKNPDDFSPWSLIHRAAEFAKPLLRDFVGI